MPCPRSSAVSDSSSIRAWNCATVRAPPTPWNRRGGAGAFPGPAASGAGGGGEVARPGAQEKCDQARVVEMRPGLAVHAGCAGTQVIEQAAVAVADEPAVQVLVHIGGRL